MTARPAEAVRGEVVSLRRRRTESQVCCDHRERRTLCRATPKGSAANGIAPQGKVVWSGRKKRRRRIFVARKHNLASSVFGSVRCRGQSPGHVTPGLPRLPRRMESARARGDACGMCRIDAHARGWMAARRRSAVGRTTRVRTISPSLGAGGIGAEAGVSNSHKMIFC